VFLRRLPPSIGLFDGGALGAALGPALGAALVTALGATLGALVRTFADGGSVLLFGFVTDAPILSTLYTSFIN